MTIPYLKKLSERIAYHKSDYHRLKKGLLMKEAFFKTLSLFKNILPMLFGILLLMSLLQQFFQHQYQAWFTGNYFLDPLIGASAGAISFGIPITSYIAGGELLHNGVSLIAVTAFIMTWTTVGLIMIPLETQFLGKRFAVARNLINFVFAILVAIATVYTVEMVG